MIVEAQHKHEEMIGSKKEKAKRANWFVDFFILSSELIVSRV
jgi:hypothetical protein